MNQETVKLIAACIKYHRKQARLSQLELAKLSGVGKSMLFDIEHEKASVQFDSLLKIFHALNIHLRLESPLMQYFEENVRA